MRKNCPCFKHNCFSTTDLQAWQPCQQGYTDDLSMAHYGSGSGDSSSHAQLLTPHGAASPWQATAVTLGRWRAMHQGCPMAGSMPSAHPELPAACWHDACVRGWGLLKGCRVPAHPALSEHPSHTPWPSGKDCRQAWAALADLSQLMGHWLTSFLLVIQVWKT